MTERHDLPGAIDDIQFTKALGDRYLSYALSTIMSRSLPDVRDGLKPVNRRLLYAMAQLKLLPKSATKKSARIVGDVIGKFHPHGELSIYDALVRLAQDFTLRYQLIEGQGNFGNIDGDNAAAMRYTEAKLSEVALTLLEGIHEDTVPFKPTYDGGEEEPCILPASFPNLLANGAVGIAVGMATSIPPHNADEICEALIYLIDHEDASIEKLTHFIPGPDFPTGGLLMESKESILKAYETGRGGFRIRAKYEVEHLKGGQYQIVVTQIPYHVQKNRLVEKIAELLFAKKLVLLGDVRDESAEDMRLVLVPRSRNIDPKVLMSTLFKHTELESRFSLNMNVVDGNQIPRVLNLRQVLQAFLDHRLDVLLRGTHFRLSQIAERLEILSGFLTIYLNLDEVIQIVRFDDTPKETLIGKWQLTQRQAEAILNMRLRALHKLEEVVIRQEHDQLMQEQGKLQNLSGDEGAQRKHIKEQLRDIKKRFGKKTALGARRTQIEGPVEEIDVPVDAYIEKEPVTIICSEKGWIRILKGHIKEKEEVKYKEGDKEKYVLLGQTTDFLLVVVASGRFYTIRVDDLPKGRGVGEPLPVLLDLPIEETIVSLQLCVPGQNQTFLVVASDGRGFLVKSAEVMAQTKNGKQILNVKAPVVAQEVVPVTAEYLAIMGENRRLLIIETADTPHMTRGRGVMLQRYRGGGVADVKFFSAEEGLTWQKGARTYREEDWRSWLGKRGNAGRFAPNGFSKSNRFKV